MTTILSLITAGTLVSVLVTLFMMGAAPQFAVRLVARIYPKGDERRAELVAEVAHIKGLVKTFELWRWLGESFAVAICEGLPARRAAQRGMPSAAPQQFIMQNVPTYVVEWDGEDGVVRHLIPQDHFNPPPRVNQSQLDYLRGMTDNDLDIPRDARVTLMLVTISTGSRSPTTA